MKQKGVYPYDYMDCEETFNDQQLPSKDKFYRLSLTLKKFGILLG